jgi:hypothetical protein
MAIRLLSRDEWERDWRPREEWIFSRDDPYRPFRDRSWRMLPIPEYLWAGDSPALLRAGGPDVLNEFEPLLATLAEIGETEICVSDVIFRDGSTLVGVDIEDIRRINAFDWALIFGRSREWGLCSDEGRLSILGGTAEFIERYLRHAGGLERVRKRFEDHDMGMGWEPSWCDVPNNPHQWEGDWQWRWSTYAMFGWTPIAYPNHGNPFRSVPRNRDLALWMKTREQAFASLPPPSLFNAENCFRPDWVRMRLPGHIIADGGNEGAGLGWVRAVLDSYWGLAGALADLEYWEVCIVPIDCDPVPPEEWGITVAWVRGLGSCDAFAKRPVAAFDPRTHWAAVSFDENVTILSAEREVVERVIQWAGGLDVLREEFQQWAKEKQLAAPVLDMLERLAPWP